MIRYILLTVAAALTAALLGACGGDREFRINGRIDGMGTTNLKLVFYSADALQTSSANAIDGRFIMTGRVDRPTLVRIYTNNGALLGRLAVEPGETVDVTFNLKEPWNMQADGNDDSEYLARFLKDNADLIKNADAKGLNAAIDRYVRKYPSRGVSGILMTDYFAMSGNEDQGAELLALLQKNPRSMASTAGLEMVTAELALPADSLSLTPLTLYGEKDSLVTIDPTKGGKTTVITVTDGDSRMSDSLTAAIPAWQKRYGKTGRGVRILDIATDPDTASWHRTLRDLQNREEEGERQNGTERFWALSPRHIRGLGRVAVGQVPWFIVTDSTGRVTYSAPRLPAK